jgi:acid phosphatase
MTEPAAPTTTAAPGGASAAAPTSIGRAMPAPDHIVVVVEENHGASEVIGNPQAPYLDALAQEGALFTASYASTHPSQPNYLVLFSGATQGVTSDACPPPGAPFAGPDLAGSLAAAGRTFTGYVEGLPAPGSTTCASGDYARKHNPWVDFADVPAADDQPLTSFRPADATDDPAALPSVAFVVPDQVDDMHSGTIGQADSWLRDHLDGYVRWAGTHNSLLVVTWDEDDGSASNHIATLIVGAHVRPGRYDEHLTHERVLRTIEDLEGAGATGGAAGATPVTDCWQ